MITIPEQLRRPEFRFIKVTKREKAAVEKDWQNTKNYRYDDPELISWLKEGNNYGVLAGHGGLVIIDADSLDVAKDCKRLPKTFVVQSGSGKGAHFYFFVKNLTKNIKFHGKKDKNEDVGQIQATKKYCVGPNCIHPSGGTYTIIEDRPIAKVTKDELLGTLCEWLERKKVYVEKTRDFIDIPITDVIDVSGFKRYSNRWQGSHPVHGSTGGMNFAVYDDGLATCFRCNNATGGGLYWLAVLEGVINCGEPLRGEKFKKALNIAIEKGLYKPPEKENISQTQDDLTKDYVLDLLEKSVERKTHYLDIGYDDERNLFWYGFNIKGCAALIFSNGIVKINFSLCPICNAKILNPAPRYCRSCGCRGKFFSQFQREFVNYDGYISNIAPTISAKTVSKFLKEKNLDFQLKDVYQEIKNKILYYMDFGDKPEIADVIACWIIATYSYPLFWWFPHLLITAPFKSGKSKCFNIILNLSFRGFDLGASAGVTPAQVFRTIEGCRGTIGLDEFEQRANKETQALVNQIFNASARRDSYIIRCEQINRKWVTKKFPIFCPKIIANISGINPVTLSRCIGLSWLATKKIQGSRKPERDGYKGFEEIRQKLYLWTLHHWQKVRDIYTTLTIDSLKNRDEDNWLPLFTIAKLIDEELGRDEATKQLMKYLEDYKQLELKTDTLEEDFFNALYDFVDEKDNYYTPKEIAADERISDLLSFLKAPANWIGRRLSSYKFSKKRLGSKGRTYLLSKKRVKDIIDLYFCTEETSLNDTNDTNDINDTNVTNKEKIHNIDKNVQSLLGKVTFSDVSDVTPKVKKNHSQLLNVLDNPIPNPQLYDENALKQDILTLCENGCPEIHIIQSLQAKYGCSKELVLQILKKMLKEGLIFEPKANFYKILRKEVL